MTMSNRKYKKMSGRMKTTRLKPHPSGYSGPKPAGTGFSLDSRSFLAINQDVQDKAEKDIANIRVNLGYDINELSLNQQAAKSKRKHEVFGGWASIASQTYEYKAKKGLYR